MGVGRREGGGEEIGGLESGFIVLDGAAGKQGGLKPGVEHVLIERNFVGSRIGKNFADDVCRQKGERYFVPRGKHDDVGAGDAAVAELDCVGVDAFDVRTRDNTAAGDVVDEGGRHGGLALGDAHLRAEAPTKVLPMGMRECCCVKYHLKGLPHWMLTMSSNRGAVRESGSARASRDT